MSGGTALFSFLAVLLVALLGCWAATAFNMGIFILTSPSITYDNKKGVMKIRETSRAGSFFRNWLDFDHFLHSSLCGLSWWAAGRLWVYSIGFVVTLILSTLVNLLGFFALGMNPLPGIANEVMPFFDSSHHRKSLPNPAFQFWGFVPKSPLFWFYVYVEVSQPGIMWLTKAVLVVGVLAAIIWLLCKLYDLYVNIKNAVDTKQDVTIPAQFFYNGVRRIGHWGRSTGKAIGRMRLWNVLNTGICNFFNMMDKVHSKVCPVVTFGNEDKDNDD